MENIPDRSNQSMTYSISPSYVSYLVSLILLLYHLNDHYMPWIGVFSPLFISNLVTYFSKFYYFSEVMEYSNNLVMKMKFICSMVDLFGYCASEVLLYFYLTKVGTYNLAFVFIPVWITTVVSVILRFIVVPTNHRRLPRNLVNVVAHTFVQIFLKVIQTMLIALRVDGEIRCNWSFVFIPVWIITSFSLVCACVLLHCSSFVHIHAAPNLRFQAVRLMVLCALQLFVIALTTLMSTIWLVQKLNFIDHIGEDTSGRVVTDTQIIGPLIAMMAALLILYPLSVHQSKRYQAMAADGARSALATRGALSSQPNESTVLLTPKTTRTWLLQLSDSMFMRTTPTELGFTSDGLMAHFLSTSDFVVSGVMHSYSAVADVEPTLEHLDIGIYMELDGGGK